MSRHRRRVKHFDRTTGPRLALFRGLMISLVEHGRISTTVDRAKELRRKIEKAITLGKKDDLATRRLLLSRVPNQDTVKAIMNDISPRFKARPGGYTRIIKIGRRPGDTAEMAFIEFVDYDYKKAAAAKSTSTEGKKGKESKEVAEAAKAKSKASKLVAKAHNAHRKSVRKMRSDSRRVNRA